MTDTTTTPSHDDLVRPAGRRAATQRGWYLHLCIYLAVNLGLYALSTEGWGQRHWSFFPLLGWGLGVALHGVAVFARHPSQTGSLK